MQSYVDTAMSLINRLNSIAYHIFVLFILPIILLVIITREIVVDIKNKLFTLNLKRDYNVRKGTTDD